MESLLSQWIVNPLKNDFGFDYEVRITDSGKEESQEVTEFSFYIQCKSTIHSSEKEVVEDLNIDDWELYLSQRIPVLLIKYDIPNKIFYWEIVQDYVWDILEKKNLGWRNKNYIRIKLFKKIEDMNVLKETIIKSQKRITRYQVLNLDIGEGIKVDKDDLKELETHSEKYLAEFKNLSLERAYIEAQKGNKEESVKQFLNVYNSPKDDEIKIQALVGVVSQLNVIDPEENNQIVNLSDEGIELSKKMNLLHFENYLIILKNRAINFTLIEKMSQILIILLIPSRKKDSLFSFFYNNELTNLLKSRNVIINKINKAFLWLFENKHIFYYIDSLSKILEMISFQITNLAFQNKKIIKEEKYRSVFISKCEYISKNITNSYLKKEMLRNLSNYYYWTCKYDKALKSINEAIKIAENENDLKFIKASNEFIKMMNKSPNPYEIQKNVNIEEINVTMYQEMFKDLIKYQGIDVNAKDKTSKLIKIALNDIDPSGYFKYCQFLHISYLNTSSLGECIGLPSMGLKLIWCKYCKNIISGFSLKNTFESFQVINCKNCSNHLPRKKDWVCTVEFVKKQENEKKFKEIVKKFRKK